MEYPINEFVNNHKFIFLFGAGNWALPLKRVLERNGVTIQGVVVSNKNEERFDNVPVLIPSEIVYNPAECGIVLGVNSRYHAEIIALLKQYGFSNYYCYDDEALREYCRDFNTLTVEMLRPYSKFLCNRVDKPISWNQVLIIRLDGIGDTVLMTPFIREFRRNHPESNITLLVSKQSFNLFENCPYIDGIFSMDTQKIVAGTVMDQLNNAKKCMHEYFGNHVFDVALLPRWDVDLYGASFLSFFSGARYSVAYSEKVTASKCIANKNYDLLFSHVVEDDSIMHEVEHNISILRECGCNCENDVLELWDLPDDCKTVNDLLAGHYFENQKIISIGLSASAENKTWSYMNYSTLIQKIIEHYPKQCFFVFLGNQESYAKSCIIEKEHGNQYIINLVGRLSLRQTFCFLKRSFMYIGNDTGLMHIATAAGNRVLEISSFPKDGDVSYGFSTYRFHPWKVPYYIAQPLTGKDDCRGWCQKPYAHCINDVSVEEVYNGFEELFNLI